MNFVSAQLPDNEERRAEAVERTGLIDSNQASLFNIYANRLDLFSQRQHNS